MAAKPASARKPVSALGADESPFQAIHKEKETLASQQRELEAQQREKERRFRPVLLIEALKDRILDFERGCPPDDVCDSLAAEFIRLAKTLRDVGLGKITKEWTAPEASGLGGRTVVAALRFAGGPQSDASRLNRELHSAFEGLSTIQVRDALDHLQLQIRRALCPEAFEGKSTPKGAESMEDIPEAPGAPPRPRFACWAFGQETGERWHVFRLVKNQWRHQGLLKGLPKKPGSRKLRLLGALADKGGRLSFDEVVELEARFNPYRKGENQRARIRKLVEPELSKLRAILRVAMKLDASATQFDPLPNDDNAHAWCAEVQIGLAEQDDNNCMRFKPRE
jgi:hypothetical protein